MIGGHCRIPDFEPTPIGKIKIKRSKLTPCKNPGFITSIASTDHLDEPLFLKIHSERLKKYRVKSVDCCYHVVERVKNNDSETELTAECKQIKDDEELNKSTRTLFAKCSSNGKEIYSNVHAIIARQHEFVDRQMKAGIDKEKAYNVILLGLDGMSRLNFQRGMPNSYKVIKDKPEWFEMKGYTALSNESFPNLFAILTGQSSTEEHESCDPTAESFLDDCSFIWRDFQQRGYVTLYAEDQRDRNTFNKRHKGFSRQPTDHYFRPFVVTAEKELSVRKKDDLAFCLGSSLYMEHIFMYAMKLFAIHQSDPTFSVFYVNSLSDKQLSSSPIMDNKISNSFFKVIEEKFNMNSTIVIYFSDTGTRFEESLVSSSTVIVESLLKENLFQAGFYEERSPMLFIRLPPRFQEAHPDYVRNLKENSNRLTTPFDLHVTLRHILSLSTDEEVPLEASGCKNCHSLFDPATNRRSCRSVNIPDDSCPCSLMPLNASMEVVTLAAQHAVDVLNQNLTNSCETLKLVNVTSAHQQLTSQWNMNYLIRFTVAPSKAQFEAFLRRRMSTLFSLSPKFELLRQIVHTNAEKEPTVCVLKTEVKRRKESGEDDDDGENYYDWDM